MPFPRASSALSRFTVLDLTRVRSGPTCVRQLADWGANVIKIETPPHLEKGEGPGGPRSNADFQNLHRNKRSITLDLKSPQGLAAFKRMVEKADVVVENFRPDVKDRLGIDYESLKKINKRIVLGSISGFGQDGPYRDRPGFDQIAQGMTATYQVSRDLGWEFFEKLAQQNILQVQSAADPPKKLALGERAIQADGVEYLIFQEKEKGQPVEPVYASEGTPIIIGPNGLFKAAPNPNAARLFQSFCFSPECQKLAVEIGGLRSVHPQVPEHQGRTPLGKIKLMKDDAAAVLKNGEQIKARYVKIFRV